MTTSAGVACPIEKRKSPIADNESMRLVLTGIQYDLSLDPTKTEKQIRKRMTDFHTALNYIAKSLKTTPDCLTVSMLAAGGAVLYEYLAQINLAHQSQAGIRSVRNTMLNYARRFGFSPASFTLIEAWEPIKAVLRPAYAAATAVVKDAIARKLSPLNYVLADLDTWVCTALEAGMGHAYVRQARWAFLAAVRNAGIKYRLPLLNLPVRQLPGYRLPLKDMPELLRAQIIRIVDWRSAEAGITPRTQREIIQHFEDYCGFAVRVCGVRVEALTPLLTEPLVKQFAFWRHKVRGCKRTTIVGALSRMFAALASCPDFAGHDFSWIRGVYRKLRMEPESALKERRRQRYIAFQQLAAIPGRIRDERNALHNPSPATLGWRVMDELLLTFLILAQYPPRFVREAVIGVNIFNAPIPTDGPPFTIPSWAQDLVCVDPGTHFWQFRYESKDGRLFRGLVLRRIVPLLDLWLNHYRPVLLGEAADPGTIFFNRARQPLREHRLHEIVAKLSQRFAKKRITITAMRSSFAHYYRERNPNKDAVLANIQWVQYPTIKLRYDEEYRKQRKARMARRRNRYS
ncbi:MAG: hypothetical protein WBY53_19855 [Acidobacteriaceae bacterium]